MNLLSLFMMDDRSAPGKEVGGETDVLLLRRLSRECVVAEHGRCVTRVMFAVCVRCATA
jgi:hypothetical protein